MTNIGSGFGTTGFSSGQGSGFTSNAGAGFGGSSMKSGSGFGAASELKDVPVTASPAKPKLPPKSKPAMPPPAAVTFSVKQDDYGASKKT